MTGTALAGLFEGIVCDLDGVVYTGTRAVPEAVEALNALDIPIVYATNNASRTAEAVAERLRSLGIVTREDAVLTSSLAAARELAEEVPPGSQVLAVGGEGVAASLRAVGLEPRPSGGAGEVIAVVQGYGDGVTASDLGAAAAAIRSGARWIATNDDPTLPTEHGLVPGNGSLVAAVRAAVDVDPRVVGKPHPPMYAMAADLMGGEPARVLAVGDRLETDIAGAVATGMPSALVTTGVHDAVDAASAPPARRPQYLLSDLRDLHRAYPEGFVDSGWHCRGAARARVTDVLEVVGEGNDAGRAALDAVWAAVDAGRLGAGDVPAIWPTGTV